MFCESHLERFEWRWVLGILMLGVAWVGSPSTGSGAVVEFGVEGETRREVIETLNASTSIGASVSPTPATTGATPASATPPAAAVDLAPWADLLGTMPHLGIPARMVLDGLVPGATTANRVLANGAGNRVTVTGVGAKTVTASADGPVVIDALLRTYNPASMRIQLVEPDGTEVLFGGTSLFDWSRPNDKANAPVVFKGVRDASSMVHQGGGDYSPRPGLRYEFDIKQGQSLVISTEGNALPESRLQVTSPAF